MKLCFSLPNFYNFFRINEILTRMSNINPEIFKTDLCFESVHGSYPYCYWNGNSNSNKGPGALYHNFVECGLKSALPLRLNMSNLNLIEEDFSNVMANIILKETMSGSAYVEVANLSLYEYIQNNYPYYRFVLSKDADIAHPYTQEILNSFLETDKFNIVELPIRLNSDIDFIKGLSNRKKLEIQINSKCPLNCEHLKECHLATQQNQFNYSEYNVYNICEKSINHFMEDVISIEEILDIYAPLGIKYYKLDMFENDKKYIDFIRAYFIKPEYVQVFNNILIKEGVL